MTADERPIDVEAEATAWLQRRLAWLDVESKWIVVRGIDGRIAVVLPRNGREGEDDPATDETE